MNKLLQLNRNLLLLILVLISFFVIGKVLFDRIYSPLRQINEFNEKEDSKFDIINPSFTINNEKEKISVKAKNGDVI